MHIGIKIGLSTVIFMLVACGSGGGSSSDADEPIGGPDPGDNGGGAGDVGAQPEPIDVTLQALIEREGLLGDAAFNRTLPQISDPLAQLGKQLFFTKSLGGEQDSACVSCHHPLLGGADDLVLPVGVGALNPDLLGLGRRDADGHGADGHRLSEAVRNPTRDDVGGRGEAAKDRKADFQDELGVPATTVNDITAHLLERKCFRRQFAHQRDHVGIRLAYQNLARWCSR